MNDFDKYGTHSRECMKASMAEPSGVGTKPEQGSWVSFVGVVGIGIILLVVFTELIWLYVTRLPR